MKIVSLFPAGSEIICNLELSDNLVAVSHECDFPLLLNKKIRVTKSIITNSMDQRMIDQLVKNAVENNVLIYKVDNKKLLEINPDIIITQGLCEVCSISENQVQATLKNNLCTLTSKTVFFVLILVIWHIICP